MRFYKSDPAADSAAAALTPLSCSGLAGPLFHTDQHPARRSALAAHPFAHRVLRLAGALTVAVAMLGATAVTPTTKVRTCAGFERQISIEGGTHADHLAACEGFERALKFFAELGYRAEAPVTIRFTELVLLPAKGGNGLATFLGGTRVVGLFDASTQAVSMTTLSAQWLKQRPYFGLDYDRELLVSVLAHESAHALSKAFYRYPVNPNTHAQEEYIAYVAQLSTMAPEKLSQVLAKYNSHEREFSHELSINDLVHAAAPHAFGVMAYGHFNGPSGGKAFMERIYSGDFKPIDLSQLF